MKALLLSLKESLMAAGESIKAAWQLLRSRAVALWRLVRDQAAAQKTVIKKDLTAFWQAHKAEVGWAAAAAYVSVVLTAALIWFGFHTPAIRRWVADLLDGTLQLPAGYALRLVRPMAAVVQAAAETVVTATNRRPQAEAVM